MIDTYYNYMRAPLKIVEKVITYFFADRGVFRGLIIVSICIWTEGNANFFCYVKIYHRLPCSSF